MGQGEGGAAALSRRPPPAHPARPLHRRRLFCFTRPGAPPTRDSGSCAPGLETKTPAAILLLFFFFFFFFFFYSRSSSVFESLARPIVLRPLST